MIGPGIRRKEIDGVEGAEAADRIGQVAPADSDPVRDPAPGTREQHRDLLQSGPGCGDDPDPAGGDDVRERERRPGNVGGAAVGAHHQQSARVGALLERTLRPQRDVVAEQHQAGFSLREECGAPQPAQPGIGQARTRGASDEPPDEPAERTGSGARPLQYRQGRCAVVAPAVEDKDHSGTAGVGPVIDILIIAVVG